MPTEPVRVGIIGAGIIALIGRVPLLRATGRAEVTALCRRDPEKLKAAQEYLGVANGYTDWREMLDKEPLDAVSIATPCDLHYEQTMAALEHGLHVLVDKPIALSGAQAWEVVRAAEGSGRVVMHHIGQRVDGVHRRAQQAIHGGEIGALRQVNGAFCRSRRYLWEEITPEVQQYVRDALSPYWERVKMPELLRDDCCRPDDWHRDPSRIGGGMFAHVGLHSIDTGLWLGGAPPLEVVALTENDGLPVECVIGVEVRLGNRALLSLNAVDNYLLAQSTRWTIYGDRGLVTMGQGEEGRLVTAQGSEPLKDQSPKQSLEAAFVACILDGAPNPSPVREGAILASFMDAVYRSIRERRIVQVELPAEA